MDRKPDIPLTDAALEREIEAALAVDPSPEFVARVRQRIAKAPRPMGWGWIWAAMAASAAAVAVAVVMVIRPAPTSRPQVSADVTVAAAPRTTTAEPPMVPPVATSPSRSSTPAAATIPAVSARQPVVNVDRTREPQVLIDRTESDALRRLLAQAHDGMVDLSALPDAVPPTVALMPPSEIVVPPLIAIEPLAFPGGEGVRQ